MKNFGGNNEIHIYIFVFEKQDQSGQTINKRVLSFDNVKSAFEFAESEMDDHWTQSIKIIFKISLDF